MCRVANTEHLFPTAVVVHVRGQIANWNDFREISRALEKLEPTGVKAAILNMEGVSRVTWPGIAHLVALNKRWSGRLRLCGLPNHLPLPVIFRIVRLLPYHHSQNDAIKAVFRGWIRPGNTVTERISG